jgi:phosphoribosylformylglycinamidine cyclo-ligase
LKIDWSAWDIPEIFKLIQSTGEIDDDEMRNVFNLGIGLITIVDKLNVDKVISAANKTGEETIIMGELTD